MIYFDVKTGKIDYSINPVLKSVVNYYHLGLKEGDKLPENYQYIGRKNNNIGLIEFGESIFHNPFHLPKTKDKIENIKNRIISVDVNFKPYFWEKLMKGEITKDQMKALHSKIKVCFCGDNLCHGHVTAMFSDYIVNNEYEFDMKREAYQRKNKDIILQTNSRSFNPNKYKLK